VSAAVVYRSRSGTTRRFAEEIGAHLRSLGVETVVGSVGEVDPATLAGADLVLLGCWTNGLMVIGQHPDQPWVGFVRAIPDLHGPKVGLFATYKILTGSMFARMRRELPGGADTVGIELKSRDGRLSEDHRRALTRFVGRS